MLHSIFLESNNSEHIDEHSNKIDKRRLKFPADAEQVRDLNHNLCGFIN